MTQSRDKRIQDRHRGTEEVQEIEEGPRGFEIEAFGAREVAQTLEKVVLDLPAPVGRFAEFL